MLVIYFHINIHVNDWFDIIWQIKNDRYTFDKNRKMKTGHLHIQHVNIKKSSCMKRYTKDLNFITINAYI